MGRLDDQSVAEKLSYLKALPLMSPPPDSFNSNSVRVAALQMKASRNSQLNLDRAIELIGQAAAQGAKLICLQELFLTPYFCQREDLSRLHISEPTRP